MAGEPVGEESASKLVRATGEEFINEVRREDRGCSLVKAIQLGIYIETRLE